MKAAQRVTNRSLLFSYAWMVSRVASAYYKEPASYYFKECLRMSWRKLRRVDHKKLVRTMTRPARGKNANLFYVPANQLKLPLPQQDLQGVLIQKQSY